MIKNTINDDKMLIALYFMPSNLEKAHMHLDVLVNKAAIYNRHRFRHRPLQSVCGHGGEKRNH